MLKIRPYENNPLKEGDFPVRCNFRCIVLYERMYHIFEEDHVHGHWRIFKRISPDGISMGHISNPLFELGGEYHFDEFGQADPTVIYDGKWKMWFDAMNRGLFWDKLGYAESDDGDNWINLGPVFSRGEKGTWDDHSVHHPVVLKHDKYYMYYSGCQKIEGNPLNFNVKNIGLATSDDGLKWERQGIVIPCGNRNEWDRTYVRPSIPVRIGDKWVMFYWGFNGIHSMGYAISDDLIHWEKQGKLISGTNEHDGVTGSHAISDGHTARVWYVTFDNCRLHIIDVYE